MNRHAARPRSWLKAVVRGATLLLLVLLAGWLLYRAAPRRTPSGQPPLAHIEAGTLEPFRSAFNAASGAPRLVLMLSPT